MPSTTFRNLTVATLGDRHRVLSGVHVRVEGGKIAAIGPDVAPSDRTVDCTGHLAIPGLVNCHHHLYQTLTRVHPAIQGAELFEWLTVQYPIWGRMSGEAVYVASKVALAELMLSGCTTASDMFYVFPQGSDVALDHVIQAAQELGIRLHAGRGSMSLGRSAGGLPPDHVVQTQEAILADTERVVAKYHEPGPGGMVRIDVMPCSPFSVTAELMVASLELARKHGLQLQTHLAETLDEERFCLEKFGVRPLGYLERMGWLGPDVYLAHGIHFTDDELDLLATTGTGVAHCPCSNCRLGSGIARVVDMRARGVRVGLGVDGSASNDGNNLLAEARQAMLVARLKGGAAAMSVVEALTIATTGGARLLNRPELGALEVGMAADLAIFDMNRLEYAGAVEHDPVGALLLCSPTPPRHVVVAGELRVEDHAIPGLDLQALAARQNGLVLGLMAEKSAV